jgi:chromosome segregation ATPase
MLKIDLMHKTIERYDTKVTEMQKQIDSLTTINDSLHEQNERLNNELTDLTQIEMSVVKTDLRKLEEKLLYNFNEYWAEMEERLEKLDTRVRFV